jgi:hypothetical protein
MTTETKTTIAKTTLGRKLAEYQQLDKMGEDKDFIQKVKLADSKRYGYKSLDDYQKDLDALESSKSHTGKRELDATFQMEFCVKTSALWAAVRNTSDDTVKTALTDLVSFADGYKTLAGIGDNAKRSDFRRMVIATVGQGTIQNYFGGWGDGSNTLRNQFGNGRLNADANNNLDGDEVTRLMGKILKTSSPYNNGQAVPMGKSSGYEVQSPDKQAEAEKPADNKAEAQAGATQTEKPKKRNHHKK